MNWSKTGNQSQGILHYLLFIASSKRFDSTNSWLKSMKLFVNASVL